MAPALTGRYAAQGRQAAGGLAAWARAEGVRLDVRDGGSSAATTARAYRDLAGTVDLLFGPYGSGPLAAAAEAVAGTRQVLVNHGGAVQDPASAPDARVVSVLGPADRYWWGLADVLAAAGVPLDAVAVLHAESGFGRATAAGAAASLARAGARPHVMTPFTAAGAAAAARAALGAGAAAVVGCGRIEDDLALGAALAGRGVAVGLVVCGVALAAERLGDAVEGWVGPCQWLPGDPPPPVPLPPGADYPAAQALAAGIVAGEAWRAAGGAGQDALWDAARALRTRTFLGPYAVDAAGRQTAHAPLLVRWTRDGGHLRRAVAWAP